MAIRVRSFSREEDYEACLALQQEVWGTDDILEHVPPRILKVSQEVGAVAAGAFETDGADGEEMVGFVWGLSGVRGGRPAHWSHMLAVRPGLRDGGVGRRLKLFQRELLLELGIRHVYWTYDPLESRNAHLNFNLLGTEAESYHRDYYGRDDTNALFAGLGTDRFVVRWELDSERCRRALAGELPGQSLRTAAGEIAFSELPVVSLAGPPMAEGEIPEGPFRVEIPSRIQELKTERPEEARAWRASSRGAIETCLGRGGRVAGFYRDAASDRSFYVMSSPEMGEHGRRGGGE